MCKDCGCSISGSNTHNHTHENHTNHDHKHNQTITSNPQLNDPKTVAVITKILDKNDKQALHNREHFEEHNVLAINLMSSPGSGKTSFLEKLADSKLINFAVIEGDLETNKDADRIIKKGIKAYQIQTGSACHLDAFMVHDALHHLPLEPIDICFVENVGNLVCPASYDVGAHFDIVFLSIPEGDDKVAKYPVMFKNVDLIVFSKFYLMTYFDFNIENAKKDARLLNPKVDIIEFSTKDDSIQKIANWIKFKMEMR